MCLNASIYFLACSSVCHRYFSSKTVQSLIVDTHDFRHPSSRPCNIRSSNERSIISFFIDLFLRLLLHMRSIPILKNRRHNLVVDLHNLPHQSRPPAALATSVV